MEAKPKVAIVVGEMLQPRFLALFDPLKDEFDVCIYALHQDLLLDRHATSLKLRVFESLADMPGYMRGLEEELSGAGLIIGFETSRLATFQAVRAARKFGVPICVVVTEHHPYFYERYANIRAIQFDIANKAERFWATSAAAENVLRLDSVPAESIGRLSPIVDAVRFRGSATGRKKFRDYVGLGATDRVVLFHNEIEAWNRPDEALRALGLLMKQVGLGGAGLKLLFAGTGAAAMDLKYRCFDMGLGKHVLFLHQDPEPFLVDMYSACDFMVLPRALPTEFHEEIPMRLLEGMACGLVPLVGAGSVAAELAGEAGCVYQGDTGSSLAAALAPLLANPAALAAARDRSVARILATNVRSVVGPQFVQEVHAVLSSVRCQGGRLESAGAVLAQIRADLKSGAERDAMVRIEEALLSQFPAAADRSALLGLKGDAHYGIGEIEAASDSYTEALKLDERNVDCLRGLGFVAWQGHSNEEALVYFKKASALRDDDPQTMLGIGLVYRRLGLTEEALFWLERCAVGYVLPPALVALAQTCAHLAQPLVGIEVLLRVIDAVGENHTLLVTLGQLYLATGRVAEGHELLQRALGGTQPAA